jgi:peptidoglycan/xylan/chitin deacetylase (PgdA/CDA1 family)
LVNPKKKLPDLLSFLVIPSCNPVSNISETVMRSSILKTLNACAVFIATAFGASTLTQVNEAQASGCRGGSGIGTHRTVTLNTSGGKRYGRSHGGAQEFLKHKEVVLTFDDGPVPGVTPKVLHTLSKHCAKATFFMVGTMAINNPSLARKVANNGHTIGIHSYSHKNLGRVKGANAIADVNRSIKAIEKSVGRDVAPFFRFPYLSENKSVNQHLKRLGYGVFAIDVDSLDYKFSKPNSMVNRIMSELKRKGKGIILMHDIQRVTANGLDQLLSRLNREGYKIVHIRGRGGKDPVAPVLVSSAEPEPKVEKPVILASNTVSEPKEKWKLRETVTQKPKRTTKKKKPARKKTTTKQALKDHKNPIRAKLKQRILQTKPGVKKSKKTKVKKVAKLNSTNAFKTQREKALKQFDKNKKAFRNAIKKRIFN